MLAAITLFGCARLGVRALSSAVFASAPPGIARWLPTGFCASAILAQSFVSGDLPGSLEWPVRFLVAVAAIVTVDYLTRGGRNKVARKIDGPGVTACVIASAVAYLEPLLPVYAAAFILCHCPRISTAVG